MQNKIYILQDCDVDGLISSVLVYKYLIHLGVKHENIIVLYHKDKRHGLNEDIMKEIKNDCKLLWIPDANPSSQQYVEDLKNKNIKIIQTDHHEIPPYDGVFSINNQYSNKVTNKSLSGAGVTYKFIKYCCEQNNDLYHQDLLDLVALSNVADVMDMKNLENRYYNFIGFSNIKNSFLSFLINELSKGIVTPTTLAWDVVPKLNAVIRSDNFELKKEIFECFIGTSEEYASVLKKIKREKNNQNKNVQLLLDSCEIEQYKNFILAYVQPSNYTGLLASKIMSKYEKPTFCLYKKNNNYNGSCRSTRDIKTFCNNSNLINFAEGHQKSFGISIPENNIDNFIKYLDTDISYEEEPTEVCCIYNKNNIPDNLFGYWDKYASLWGKNLNEPIFYIENIEISVKDIAVLGRNKSTLKWNINHIDFIYFFADQKLKEKLYNGESDKIILNIVGKLKINDWNNHKIKQVVVDKIEIKKYNKYNSWKELF